MPVFSIPLSGLNASSTALSTIANNLANINTVGYKGTRTTFQDLYYQNIGATGAGNPKQVGAGVGVATIDTNFNGGNVDSSGVATDVAISGDGFFTVAKDGETVYTRAGNFSVNDSGFLATQDGYLVQGYPAVKGVIDPTGGLGPLQLGKGQINPPNATTQLQMRTNLDAGAAVGDTFSTPVTIYDSLGTSHVLSFNFTKASANTWNYDVSISGSDVGIANPGTWVGTSAVGLNDTVIPNPPNGHMYRVTTAGTTAATSPVFPTGAGATVTDGTAVWTEAGTYPPIINSGTLSFDGLGNLSAPTANVSGITVSSLADGAAPINFNWNLYDPTGAATMTQMSAKSSTASTSQDGSSPGTLLDFKIGSDGIIQGSFTNGTRALGQIVLASFGNEQGLQRLGSNNFTSTLASGNAVLGQPGTGGRGGLSGGAIELSNVDMATEFARLITAQRAFEANAHTITTFDEISQDTINMKR
jgi:flagellar hook protein FlgE